MLRSHFNEAEFKFTLLLTSRMTLGISKFISDTLSPPPHKQDGDRHVAG